MSKKRYLSPGRLPDLLAELRRSRKYKSVSEAVALRALRSAAESQPDHPGRILKSAKRRLHQIYGAFHNPAANAEIEIQLNRIADARDEEAVKAACRSILQLSVSTRERLEYLTEIYSAIFASAGRPCSLLDLACGLNPFSRPWMPLPKDTDYTAVDIDEIQIQAVNRFFTNQGYAGRGKCADLLDSSLEPADMAFLFKILPSLERQEKGAGQRLLQDLPAAVIVVSYPAQTLGGRDKGMRGQYKRQIERLAEGIAADVITLEFPTETFYILKRR